MWERHTRHTRRHSETARDARLEAAGFGAGVCEGARYWNKWVPYGNNAVGERVASFPKFDKDRLYASFGQGYGLLV